MSRFMAMALMLGVVVGLLSLPVGLAHATTMTGQVVDLSGVNDFNATADSQTRTGIGKLLGYAGIAGTAGAFFAGYVGTAAAAGTGTMVWIFGTRIVNSGMDAASSAPLVGDTVYRLSQGLQATLGLMGMRLWQDPVFYVALVMTVLLLASRRTRTPQQRLA